MDATRKLSRKNAIKVPRGDKIYYGIVNLFLFLFFMAILLPLINVVASSFSEAKAVNQGKVLFWPVQFTTKGYKAVFEYRGIWRSYANTFLYTITGTAVNLAMTLMCAYPLARKDLPFKGPVVALFMFTMLFGGGLVPYYILVHNLGLLNSIWSLVLPLSVPVSSMVILMNFMRNLPPEIEEAAMIDGAGIFRILWSILLPVLKPSLATVGLFAFVYHWNDWFTGALFMNNPANYPLQTYLQTLLTNFRDMLRQAGSDYYSLLSRMNEQTGRAAQLFLGLVPILVVYPFVQKYFTTGLVMGSVKG